MPNRDLFAAWAREALGEMSVREAARRSGGAISTTSILNMLGGHIPYAEVIANYALATGADPDRGLELAGKPFSYRELAASVIFRVGSGARSAAPALGLG